MTLKPYKFVVHAIAQQVDDDGNVTGEVTLGSGDGGQPFVIYGGAEGLTAWADGFPDLLASVQQPAT